MSATLDKARNKPRTPPKRLEVSCIISQRRTGSTFTSIVFSEPSFIVSASYQNEFIGRAFLLCKIIDLDTGLGFERLGSLRTSRK